jgi:flagellar hook-basal body protein
MSFYTSLTGLNAATAALSVTSNNIANTGTTGFKRSRADFGDIFATSPLQKASSVIGQGVALKQVSQEFSQGNIQFSASSLDLAITGDGFFPLKSPDGLQDIYTRNGTFLLDDSFAVVNSAGQFLQAAVVDSNGKADLENLKKLIIPRSTNGDARETTLIDLALNLPAEGNVIEVPFDKNDPVTYNLTTSVTVFDAGGNEYLATVYYQKTKRASPDDPTNKWQTHVFIGDTKLNELLIQAADAKGATLYVNKYGEIRSENGDPPIPPQDIARGVTKLFNLDDLKNRQPSVSATASGSPLTDGFIGQWKNGFNLPNKLTEILTENPIVGVDSRSPISFALNIDGSREPVTVDLSYLNEPGASLTKSFTGVEIAREMTNTINKVYGDQRYFNFSALKASDTATSVDLFELSVSGRDAKPGDSDRLIVSLNELRSGASAGFGTFNNLSEVLTEEAVLAIQSQINEKAFDEGLLGANALAISEFFSAINTKVQASTDKNTLVGTSGTLTAEAAALRAANLLALNLATEAKEPIRTEQQQLNFTVPAPAITGTTTKTITVGGSQVTLTAADTTVAAVAAKVQRALLNDRFGAESEIQTISFSDPTTLGTLVVGSSVLQGEAIIPTGGVEVTLALSDTTAALAAKKVADALKSTTSTFTGQKQEVVVSMAGSAGASFSVAGVAVTAAANASALTVAIATKDAMLPSYADHNIWVAKQNLEFTAPSPALATGTTKNIQVAGVTVELTPTESTGALVASKVAATLSATAPYNGDGYKVRAFGNQLTVEYPSSISNKVPGSDPSLALTFSDSGSSGVTALSTASVAVEFPASAQNAAALAVASATGATVTTRTVREFQERKVVDNGDGTISITYAKDDDDAEDLGVRLGTAVMSSQVATDRDYAAPTAVANSDGSLAVTYIESSGDAANMSFVDSGTSGVTMSVATIREFRVTQSERQIIEFSDPTATLTSDSTITIAGVTVNLTAEDTTAAAVASRVAQKLRTDAFITSVPGRSVTDNLDGTITIEYALVDKDAEPVTLIDNSATGVRILVDTERDFLNTDDLTDKEFAQSVAESVAPLQMAAKLALDAKQTKQQLLQAIESAAGVQAPGNAYYDLVEPSLQAARNEASRTSSTALSVYEAVLASANGPQRAAIEAYSSREATASNVLAAITEAQVTASSVLSAFLSAITVRVNDNTSSEGTLTAIKDFVLESTEARVSTANTNIARADAFRAIQVGYDEVNGSFTFKGAEDDRILLGSASSGRNDLFGLELVPTVVDPQTGTYGSVVFPNGREILARAEQRYGIKVTFNDTDRLFEISSGTTGDTSSVKISDASDLANLLFGFTKTPADEVIPAATGATPVTLTSSVPVRGIQSMPAVLKGSPIGINIDNKFAVDARNDTFVVTVDNVTSLIQMPRKPDYNIEEFRDLLERRINSMADSFGRTTNGVRVAITTNPVTNTRAFEFKTGTTGNSSFLKISGPSVWGLSDLESARGQTTEWIEPIQATDADGFPLYVDRDGRETTDAGDFSEEETRDLWAPVFLDKGELTFNTAGQLVSPLSAIRFASETIGTSGATLGIAIDYVGSTQFSNPFAVLAQSQNGRPEGDLIGLDIADDGLVSANYSNGSQKNLAKIVLANFANPTGLRQIGDASYYSTSKSGAVTLGEAGTAGYGTVRAGARERANVDLTAELIELITNQRNFQANAKAIETNNTLTQAIINIR